MRTTRTSSPFDAMREMHRVFETLAARDLNNNRRTPARRVPPINLWIEDGTIFIEAELPGATLDDVEILAERETLTLKASRTINHDDDATVLRAERADLNFERSVNLPLPIDVDNVAATLTDGVLRIALPAAETLGPRRVPISTAPTERTTDDHNDTSNN